MIAECALDRELLLPRIRSLNNDTGFLSGTGGDRARRWSIPFAFQIRHMSPACDRGSMAAFVSYLLQPIGTWSRRTAVRSVVIVDSETLA